MNDEAAELLSLESQAAQAEAQLEQDLAAAQLAATQAAKHLAQLQATAGKLAGHEELASVCREVRQLEPTRFEEGPMRAGAITARRAALQHRRKAGEALREALQSFNQRTTELEMRVAHQSKWLSEAQRKVQERQAAPVAPVPMARADAAAPRRESPRVSMCTEVDLGSDSNFYGGFSTNLSEGGLFIATVSTPPKGTLVELTFTLPGGVPIKAQGVVRWTREVNDALPEMMPGAGVEFVDLGPEVAASISEFVMKRDPLFYVD